MKAIGVKIIGELAYLRFQALINSRLQVITGRIGLLRRDGFSNRHRILYRYYRVFGSIPVPRIIEVLLHYAARVYTYVAR